MRRPRPSRRWLGRGVLMLVVIGLLAPVAVSAATYEPTAIQRGTMETPAQGLTVVSVQGFHYMGYGSEKKPARLVAFGPRGNVKWIHNGVTVGAKWFYDVDVLENGNLLVVATRDNGTLVYELDYRDDRIRWIETFPYDDTHDVDAIGEDRLLIARMRGYNETTGLNDESVLVYNRSSGQVVWEWLFRDHYSRSIGGEYTGDWTHVNDVDAIDADTYLVSVRNFNQVIFINRSSGAIVDRLGTADGPSPLYHQHNPQYLRSDSGRPTLLVADSEEDRIVEFEQAEDEWNRTWELTGSFSWPRDADRLPDGNTLIVDSLNNRVVEVTPRGEIVWEVYVPWGPYDVERVAYGEEAGGPTIADQQAAGAVTLSGSAGLEPGTGDRISFAQRVQRSFDGTPLAGPAGWFASRWAHITPWIYPVWMTGWDFAAIVSALLVVLGWGIVEFAAKRGPLAAYFRRHVP